MSSSFRHPVFDHFDCRARIQLTVGMVGHLFAVLLAIGSATAWGQTGNRSDYPRYQAPESTLSKFTSELKNVVQLSAESGKLIPKFETNGNTARSELQAASQKVPGANGGSSSSSGGENWSMSIRGNQLSIAAGYGLRYGSPFDHPALVNDKDSFYMQLQQSDGDQPRVLFSAKEDGSLEIQLDDLQGAHTFQFSQSAKGIVHCLELGPDFQFAATAENFDKLAAGNPDYVARRLTPLFKYAGIGAPPSRFSPIVRDQVLQQLRPTDAKRQESFLALVEKMNADQFEDRESASKEIDLAFAQWRPEIQAAIGNPQFAAEVRARLKKIHDANVSSVERTFQELASQNKLDQDPDYLVWMLEGLLAQSPVDDPDVDLVVEKLEQLTEQTFGRDMAQWHQWEANAKRPAAAQTNLVATETLLKTNGILDEMAKDLANLLQLKVADEKLVLDRDRWKQLLGGKSVQEISQEVKDYIKEKNLPPSWFQPGGGSFPEQTVQFPQVVFERMVSGQEVDNNYAQRMAAYSRYIRNTGNREFVGVGVVGILEVHKHDQRQMFFGQANQELKDVEHEYLTLEFQESAGQFRRLYFFDNLKGAIVASVRFPSVNSELRLIQRETPDADGNAVYLFDARGSEVQYFVAPTFGDLKSKHADYWQNQALPVFQKLGLTFIQ